MMLAQLLELRGYCAILVSTDSLAAEMIEMVEKKKADVVCVSAMPPAAVVRRKKSSTAPNNSTIPVKIVYPVDTAMKSQSTRKCESCPNGRSSSPGVR